MRRVGALFVRLPDGLEVHLAPKSKAKPLPAVPPKVPSAAELAERARERKLATMYRATSVRPARFA